MAYKFTQKSFTGGEISPALHAGDDLAKYANGLKTLKNGFVRQERCVSNRAGLELVGEVKNSDKKVRLIPFSFNTQQTYQIEVGENYFRFIKDGGFIVYPNEHEKAGEIVEIETDYSQDEIFNLKYAQNADVLTITHPNHPQIELSRHDHHDWRINVIDFKASILPPSNVNASWSGSLSAPLTYSYLVTAVDEKTQEESNRSASVEVQGQQDASWLVGEYMMITYNPVDGANEYNIYRSVNGVYAYIGTSTTTSFKDTKIEPDLSAVAPIYKNPFENNNYPSTVNYFQQRKIYANSNANPETLWASQTATSDNFNISRPLNASDAITLSIHEREVNEIRHLIGLDDLIVLTSSSEWKVNGTDGVFSASPLPMATVQSYYGCSHVMPVVSGNMILFVQSGGSVVRDLGYTYTSDSYDGDELSIFANHLFEGKQVVDMAYAKEPYRILWCVMSDGTVNGLTYNRKQEISAWHRHETKGSFESVSVIREGFEDVAYFVIKRLINGQTKRFIERMATRIINSCDDGFFVDCGLRYKGEPISVVQGLEHLENEEVIILADGGVVTGKIVKNGSVTLPKSASNVVVGLPYEFELETLNFETEQSHGLKKRINRSYIRIDKSREDFFIQNQDGSSVQNPRFLDGLNNASRLYSGSVESFPTTSPKSDTTLIVKQPYPLPLTILSISCIINMEN